jgi:hypothetical protein
MTLQETPHNGEEVQFNRGTSKFKSIQQWHQLQHKTLILNSQKVKDRTNIQNSINPWIKILVKKSMKQIASYSKVENTHA